jgi:hypothetical protein
MITQPTVFILGAGASRPFDYPTGRELVDNIIALRGGTQLGSEIQALKTVLPEIHEHKDIKTRIIYFINELKKACPPSVDFFVETKVIAGNNEYEQIGKVLIAREIIKCENENRLYFVTEQGRERYESDWYGYLWSNLLTATTIEELKKNQLSFITFNYDRSLEHFLFNAIKSLYSKSDEEVADIIRNNIKIVHVYGMLTELPWQTTKGGCPYSANDNIPERYIKALENIHLIGAERGEGFQEAQKLIKQAQSVHFLGFGYNKINLNRLNIPHRKQGFNGTFYGMKKSEISCVADYMSSVFDIYIAPLPNVRLLDNDSQLSKINILDYLRMSFERKL